METLQTLTLISNEKYIYITVYPKANYRKLNFNNFFIAERQIYM